MIEQEIANRTTYSRFNRRVRLKRKKRKKRKKREEKKRKRERNRHGVTRRPVFPSGCGERILIVSRRMTGMQFPSFENVEDRGNRDCCPATPPFPVYSRQDIPVEESRIRGVVHLTNRDPLFRSSPLFSRCSGILRPSAAKSTVCTPGVEFQKGGTSICYRCCFRSTNKFVRSWPVRRFQKIPIQRASTCPSRNIGPTPFFDDCFSSLVDSFFLQISRSWIILKILALLLGPLERASVL